MGDQDRNLILSRVREALAVETAADVKHATASCDEQDVDLMRRCSPVVKRSLQGMIDAFREKSIALKTRFEVFDSFADVGTFLCELAREEAWTQCAAHGMSLLDTASTIQATGEIWQRQLGVPTIITDDGYDRDALERCDAAITSCDALIAQTASVLVTSRSAGGRALSVLPPHHVVIATVDQLLPDLAAGYELLEQKYGSDYPSWMGLITGPSRTGDIERILVLGAHGPKRLTVCLAGGPR